MADKILVTPEQLKQKSKDIQRLAQNYQTEYEKVYTAVDKMKADGNFDGADYEEFRNKVVEFKKDFQKMKQLMDDYANFLSTTANQYEQTQNDAVKSARSLSGGSN